MKAVKDVALKSPYIIYISPHFLYIHLQPPPPIHFHVFVSNRGTSLPPLLSLLSSSPSDVCALVRRWEPGPHGAHLQTAKGEDPGHHWVVHPPVPRIPGALPQAHPYLPQILPSDEKRRFWGTRQQYICEYNVHTREYIYLKIYYHFNSPVLPDTTNTSSPYLCHGWEHPCLCLWERDQKCCQEDEARHLSGYGKCLGCCSLTTSPAGVWEFWWSW